MSDDKPAIHPLLQRLNHEYGYPLLSADTLGSFVDAPGDAVLFFAEEPKRYRETLDVAVILPELARASARGFRAAVLLPELARQLAPRYGVRRWPALVFLRASDYVGAIEGLLDWADYLGEVERLLAAPIRRPPGIGIVVASDAAGSHCH
jgi:hydrogenase-1 operon protein HyaE